MSILAQTDPSTIDRLIIPISILLILSLINERVIAFIKYWGGFSKVKYQRKISTKNTNLSDPNYIENRRVFRIEAISVITGICISFLCQANLFDMFDSDFKFRSMTCDEFENSENKLNIVIGCLLTGIFLAPGSKFFHDLLDLLLDVKNIKRNASSIDYSKITSSDELIKQAFENETKNIELFLKPKIDEIKHTDGVISCHLRHYSSGTKLMVNIFEDKTISLPKSYEFVNSNGMSSIIPVEIQIVPNATTKTI